MAYKFVEFPTWRYCPKTGEGKIFKYPEDIPEGWTDDPYAHQKTPKATKKRASRKTLPSREDMTDFLIAEGVEFSGDETDDELLALVTANGGALDNGE